MHIEIQVALNFVISYLYNKLPRRRVNIFGEELEKALKDKFQGHWYPEKPYKGSAFRCLKTGDPIDAVLERAARESGVPIHDILENLPSELSVWVDPGEVSYRIGEKNVVKILYSENTENHEDNSSADREVNKTFNPEAACFRPIDAINTSLNNLSLSLSPKTSPLSGSSPHSMSSTSPTYKGSPNPVAVGTNGVSFLSRTQAPLTFTTATFAQTKFGSTKLKTSSKRTNSSSYRMSPTEFSNYIKQRAIQQQQQQLNHNAANSPLTPNHFGPIGPVSPARSLSPNPLSLNMGQNNANADPFYFPNLNLGANMGYQQFTGHRNIFDTHFQQQQQQQQQHNDATTNGIYNNVGGGINKFSSYLDPNGFYGLRNQLQQQQQQQQQSQVSPQQQNTLNLKIKIGNNGLENGLGIKSPSIADDKDPLTLKANTAAKSSNSILSNNNNITINNINNHNNSNNNKLNAIAVTPSSANHQQPQQQQQQQQQQLPIGPIQGPTGSTLQDSKLLVEGLNSFYSSGPSSYQQLLVAN